MTGPTTADTAPDTAAVENLLQVFVKGLRAIQLYLPNNPVYRKAVENIEKAFAPVWEECSELELQVAENELVWDGAVVLSQPKSESVAWVLYKDGIRTLTFLPGVESDECVRFLQVINKAKHLPPEASDDLLTLIWEQEFELLKYRHVELAEGDVPALEPSEASNAAMPAAAVQRELREDIADAQADTEGKARSEAAGPRPKGIVDLEEFDATLYFLDAKEVAYLKGEVEREYAQNLRASVLAMIFDLLELQTYSTVRAELLSIIESFIPYLLGVGDYQSVAYVLSEIRVILQRAREVLPEHRDTLEELPAKLSQAESLSQLLQSLDEAHVHPTEEELGSLFRELRPDAIETLLTWLPKLTNQRVRELLGNAARRLAASYPDRIGAAITAENDEVVLEAVRLSGQLKLPPTVPALGRALMHESSEIRRAAVTALASIGSPGALRQLEVAVQDADRDVRVGAVRVFGERGYRGAFAKIEGIMNGNQLRDADLTEKTAFFEAFGTLAGPSGIAKLEEILKPKGFMKRREDPETRACAAMALGKIGTPEARAVLDAVVDDKDPLVRNAVNRAIRGLT